MSSLRAEAGRRARLGGRKEVDRPADAVREEERRV